MNQPRLIFVNRFFSPDESATSQLLTDLCAYLAARGWNVRVITSDRIRSIPHRALPREDRLEGVKVSRVWVANLGGEGSLAGRTIDYLCFYVGAFIMLLQHCRHGDIVIAKTDPPLIALPAALAARFRGARIVNWLQDLYPEVAVQLGVRVLRGLLGRILVSLRNRGLRRAAANVTIGQRMSDRVSAAGAENATIICIPNWSNEDEIRPVASTSSSFRQALGIPNEAFVLGYSGNLGRAHEWQTVFDAARLLRHRPEILFLFVGGGHESDRLKERVAKAGLANFVFQRHRPREELPDSLAAADAHWISLRPELEGLIVPSKFYGIAAAGRPLIAVVAPDGDIAQMVRWLDCGFVVEPGDAASMAAAIMTLAESPELRAHMGQRARAGLEANYTRHLALARWESLLSKIASDGETKNILPPTIDREAFSEDRLC
jgi:colanic acid biosynthesis glycosyl transferase WcaI